MSDADRIRALAATEPNLRQAEIARRLGVKRQCVHHALKSSPCPECRRQTKKPGLCHDCAYSHQVFDECEFMADHVRIPLRNRAGEITAWTLVNIGDAQWITRHRWFVNPSGYVHRRERKHEDPRCRLVQLHRAVLGLGHGDELQADHINGDRLDNRRENLRAVTQAQNAQNTVRRAPGSSRFRGVWFCPRGSVWVADVSHLGKHHYGGRFTTEEAAARAAAELRSELFTHANEERHA